MEQTEINKTKEASGEEGNLENGYKSLNRVFEAIAQDIDKVHIVEELTGLKFPLGAANANKLGFESGYLTDKETASFAIGNVWLSNRVTPTGQIVSHVIVTLAQKRGVAFELDDTLKIDKDRYFVPDGKGENLPAKRISFNGGCTLVFDLAQRKLRCVIKKPMDDEHRMKQQFLYENGSLEQAGISYFDNNALEKLAGPFAVMHGCSAVAGEHHD